MTPVPCSREQRVKSLRLLSRVPLHCHFGLEAFDVTIDRGDREHTPIALIAQQAILRHDIAVDRQFVPFLGVADVVYRDIIVLTPEEGYGDKLLTAPEDVERSGRALALGDNPVLDADGLAAVRIGPARDVSRSEEAGHARVEIGVYDHSAVELKAGLLGKFGPGAHADA